MVHNLGLLSKFKELTGLEINKVHLLTREQVTIKKTGDSQIIQDRTLHNVLYIPDFTN